MIIFIRILVDAPAVPYERSNPSISTKTARDPGGFFDSWKETGAYYISQIQNTWEFHKKLLRHGSVEGPIRPDLHAGFWICLQQEIRTDFPLFTKSKSDWEDFNDAYIKKEPLGFPSGIFVLCRYVGSLA